MSSLLVVKNVTMQFGGLFANKDVSTEVDRGEIVGLIGPNGAGKTTLFSVISGFNKPTSGEVSFDGANITGLKPNQICKLGLARTFQIVQPFEGISVLENVQIAAFNRVASTKKAREKAEEVLERVGLQEKRYAQGNALTIGDRKRLEVAKALATDPKVILLDEVMAGLRPKETEDTIEIVRNLHKAGITFILVEHVMKVIMSLANKIIVLHHGQKLAQGTPKEVVENPKVIDAYLGGGGC